MYNLIRQLFKFLFNKTSENAIILIILISLYLDKSDIKQCKDFLDSLYNMRQN